MSTQGPQPEAKPEMREPSLTVRLKVHAKPGSPDTVRNIRYSLSEDAGGGQGYLKGDVIDFDGADWKEPALLQFTIDDDTRYQLKFRAMPQDCFWANKGTRCPTGPGNAETECWGSKLSSNRDTLTVYDRNSNRGRIQYALVMNTNDGDNPTAIYDPVIENRGTS